MANLSQVAAAVSGVWAIAACTTVSAPEQSAMMQRAGTVEPVIALRNSGGVGSEGLYRIGRYYQGQQRNADALAYYRRAIAEDRNHAEAHNALGVVLSQQGQYADAEAAFKAAIAIAPARSHLHANLGYHYLQYDRLDEARNALREAIRLNSANALAWRHLALAEHGLANAAPAAHPRAMAGEPAAPAPSQSESRAEPGASVPASPAAETPRVAAGPVSPASGPDQVAAPATPLATPAPAVVHETPAAPLGATPLVSEVLISPGVVAETVETVPQARLVSVAPSVFELRPRQVLVAPPIASAPAPARVETAARAGLSAAVRFEISNGNGITSLAKSVGAYIQSLGAARPRLTNQRPFDQRHTEIHYVTGMESPARNLQEALETPADLVEKARLDRGIEVKLVLGRDFHERDAVARLRREFVGPVMLAREAARPQSRPAGDAVNTTQKQQPTLLTGEPK